MISFEILPEEGVILIFDVEDKFPDFSINMDDYWRYIKENDLHQYCIDGFDPATSSHVQKTGSLTFDEYFDQHPSFIKKDLEIYLKKKKLI